MPERRINQNCPVSATLRLIGGKYKALLLWHLRGQTLRFNQLRRLVPEATPKMLTQQLRDLEDSGLVRREVFPMVPPKVEYSLTARGQSLFPILEAMYDWGAALMRSQGIQPDCSMSGRRPDICDGTCRGKQHAPAGGEITTSVEEEAHE